MPKGLYWKCTRAKVLCIEGDSRFMSDLKCNTAQISGVTIAEAILSDRCGQISGAFVRENGTTHVALREGNDLLQVQTLDNLLTAYPAFTCPDIIKIDTDGFELGRLNRPNSLDHFLDLPDLAQIQ